MAGRERKKRRGGGSGGGPTRGGVKKGGGKGKGWVLSKKAQMRKKGYDLAPDTKYTARKRKRLV
jgi:18S rRNA (guanine1575-N7)-methyltransferase